MSAEHAGWSKLETPDDEFITIDRGSDEQKIFDEITKTTGGPKEGGPFDRDCRLFHADMSRDEIRERIGEPDLFGKFFGVVDGRFVVSVFADAGPISVAKLHVFPDLRTMRRRWKRD